MSDLVERLEERAVSYEQSGPSAHHTAALLREAKAEIERLRAVLEEIAGDPTGVSSYQADLAKEALQ